jgi:hypothetical protein
MSRIAAEFRFPAMTEAQYDSLIADFRAAETADPALAAGRVIHVAMPDGDGWLAFDVWDSAEAFERLGQTLGPIFAKHGISPPRPTVYPVHNTMM